VCVSEHSMFTHKFSGKITFYVACEKRQKQIVHVGASKKFFSTWDTKNNIIFLENLICIRKPSWISHTFLSFLSMFFPFSPSRKQCIHSIILVFVCLTGILRYIIDARQRGEGTAHFHKANILVWSSLFLYPRGGGGPSRHLIRPLPNDSPSPEEADVQRPERLVAVTRILVFLFWITTSFPMNKAHTHFKINLD
jgi:hypothetical protein